MVNKKTKLIIMLEFKRASDTAETYYSDMRSIIAGQRSVREKEYLETMKTFGISSEDGKRIIYRLGSLLLLEHEKLFASY